jgi:hypothetical protein
MRGNEGHESDGEKVPYSLKDDEWIALGVTPALLRSARIYQDGVRELRRIEKLNLALGELNDAKRNLDERISNRLWTEVGPLMPSKRPDLAGTDAFYAVTGEIIKSGLKSPKKAHEALRIGLIEFDAEQRFATTVTEIVSKHNYGDRKSSRNYVHLLDDSERVRYGEGLPRFRGNIDHRIVMQNGLGLGLERLSASKLAQFYDEFCPCLVDAHDADDLRKLRNRILEDGIRARKSTIPKFSGTNQRVILRTKLNEVSGAILLIDRLTSPRTQFSVLDPLDRLLESHTAASR